MDENQAEEIKTRRQDELEALQAFYGHQLRSSLPAALSPPPPHHNGDDNGDTTDEISLNGPWFIELLDTSTTNSSDDNTYKHYKIPTLEIRLPSHYPLSPAPPTSSQTTSHPTPILHHVDNNLLLTSLQKQSLIEELLEMYEPEMDMAILWAERCREEFLDVDLASTVLNTTGNASLDANGATVDQNADDDTDNCNTKQQKQQQSPSIRFLSYNHLLYGKSHKKESQIVSLASKLGLVGFIVYGTPGIIGLLLLMSNEDDDEDVLLDFAKDCSSRIGKKATVLEFEMKFAPDGGLLASRGSDNAVVDVVVGGRSKSGAGGKNKSSSSSSTKNKKSKSKGNDSNNKGNDNKGNSSSSSNLGGSSTPLLVNLLGEDRVTITNDDSASKIVKKKKSGLRHFDSLAELKEVLPGDVVQSILGL